MHDTVSLEERGVPTVAVVSHQFRTAAQAQGDALGFDPAVVYVTHPIQDRTDAELVALAQGALNEIWASLTAV